MYHKIPKKHRHFCYLDYFTYRKATYFCVQEIYANLSKQAS